MLTLSQFWMSAVATTMPVPCGAFMPVFLIGEPPSVFGGPAASTQAPERPCDPQEQHLADWLEK